MPARAIFVCRERLAIAGRFLDRRIVFGTSTDRRRSSRCSTWRRERDMKKYLITSAVVLGIAAPAYADDVGVHAGPTGAGVTVGETHDRDRPVIKEHEHSDSKTVIKREDENGNREKTVIHHDHD